MIEDMIDLAANRPVINMYIEAPNMYEAGDVVEQAGAAGAFSTNAAKNME